MNTKITRNDVKNSVAYGSMEFVADMLTASTELLDIGMKATGFVTQNLVKAYANTKEMVVVRR